MALLTLLQNYAQRFAGARPRPVDLRRQLVLTGVRHDVVKIHGQQRTGTNFVHKLLKANAPGVICLWPEEGGWKHGPFEVHRRWRYLVVARHPVAWLESFHNWEVAHGRAAATSLAEFLRTRVAAGPLVSAWGVNQPMALYSASYSRWLGSASTTALVRYEDLLEDFRPTMSRLFDELCIPAPAEYIDVTERADWWKTAIVRRPLSRERSLRGWRSMVSDSDLELVRSQLPKRLLDQLGYEI